MNGRAVVLKQPQVPMTIEEFPVPDPEPGAIVVRITQAGVCGSDLHTWRGVTACRLGLSSHQVFTLSKASASFENGVTRIEPVTP